MFQGLELKQLQLIVVLVATMFLGLIIYQNGSVDREIIVVENPAAAPQRGSLEVSPAGETEPQPAESLAPVATPEPSPTIAAGIRADGRVDVNLADSAALETLPGIGPKKAEAILRKRQEIGFFSEPDDLLLVSGIGEKTRDSLIDYVFFSRPDNPQLLAARQAAPVSSSSTAPQGRIPINSANASELEKLSGIGPVLAERILAKRRSLGRFSSANDLMKVKGIGPKTVEKILPEIIFD